MNKVFADYFVRNALSRTRCVELLNLALPAGEKVQESDLVQIWPGDVDFSTSRSYPGPVLDPAPAVQSGMAPSDRVAFLVPNPDNPRILVLSCEQPCVPDLRLEMPLRCMSDALRVYVWQEGMIRHNVNYLESLPDRDPNVTQVYRCFLKADRTIPVTSVVLYLGPDRWTGPTDLHSILHPGAMPENVKDYDIRVISPGALPLEIGDVFSFRTDLGYVLFLLKHQKHPGAIEDLIFRGTAMSESGADLVRRATAVSVHSKLDLYPG